MVKTKKFPYTRTLVRRIYGLSDEGDKKLLYEDEIEYTVRNKRDEGLFHVAAFNDGTELMNRKIKLEMYDKAEMPKSRRDS